MPRGQGGGDDSTNIASRLMLLKALEKSRRVHCWLSCNDVISWEVACTMASQPPWTLTPSCRGASREMAREHAREARHFETSRHSTSPTAMERWPPFLFLLARREAPQRCGVMVGGGRPAASSLKNLVREERNRLALSGEGQPTASWRWLGQNPEGPGAEPLGKDRTPLLTADSLTVSGGGT